MSVFMKVKCSKCGNEQIVFSHPSREVKCLKCGEVIMESTGGKGVLVNAEVVEIYE